MTMDLSGLAVDEAAIVRWRLKRRKDQTCPDPRPFIWCMIAGRGAGKTFTASNHIFEYARYLALTLPPGQDNDTIRVACVGDTFSDVQKTMMEGATGLLNVIPKELQIKYNRASTELWVSLPGTDRIIYFTGYTSQVPGKLRGPQHHVAWLDEPAKYIDADQDPMGDDTTFSNMMLGLRLGKEVNAPHCIVTGTPTNCKLIRYFVDNPDGLDIAVTTVPTWKNIKNLPEHTQRMIKAMNPKSRRYRQEILGELLLDNPAAIFDEDTINHGRTETPDYSTLQKVLGWDPSAGVSDDGDEAGIVLCGFTPEVKEKAKGLRGGRPRIIEFAQAYVLEDLSGHLTPLEQGKLVLATIFKHRVGDLVWESNQGSEILLTMLKQILEEVTLDFTVRKDRKRSKQSYGSIQRYTFTCTVEDPETGIPFVHKFVGSAVQVSKNKKSRAETAALKYDQKLVHHPLFADLAKRLPTCEKEACKTSLEDQMISWDPAKNSHRGNSPDRLDALVYALFLIFGPGTKGGIGSNAMLSAPTGDSITSASKDLLAEPSREVEVRNRVRAIASIFSLDMTNGRYGDGRLAPEDMNSPWADRIT